MKIGVYDSGVGGLTVLSELKKAFPSLDFLYLGDTANLPYGSKSPAQVEKLSIQCAEILKSNNVDAVVVACNTASSLALDAIKKVMGTVPVIGVIEPGAQAVIKELDLQKEKNILVLATKATVKSGAYRKIFSSLGVKANIVDQACPLLVPFIEEDFIDHPSLDLVLEDYLKKHKETMQGGIALLACTHYPWLHEKFEKLLPGWHVINSAQAVASYFKTWISPDTLSPLKSGSIEFLYTDPDSVPQFVKKEILS